MMVKLFWMDPKLSPSVFDWCWIMENAEQIHIVDTCLNYIIDTLDLKADTLICHPRHYKNTEECVGKLFDAPWQWVDYERWLWREKVTEELDENRIDISTLWIRRHPYFFRNLVIR